MALSHILHAISADIDAEIRTLSNHHAETLRALDITHKKAIDDIDAAVARRKEERLQSLRARATSHIQMKRRHALLARKREIIDRVYADAARSLAALPVATLTPMLERWIRSLPCTGTIRPARAHAEILRSLRGPHTIGDVLPDACGGFRFESTRIEKEFTFEFLVDNILRPMTEIDVARRLFPAS